MRIWIKKAQIKCYHGNGVYETEVLTERFLCKEDETKAGYFREVDIQREFKSYHSPELVSLIVSGNDPEAVEKLYAQELKKLMRDFPIGKLGK